MDWPLAINRNRTALLAIAAAIAALIGDHDASGPIARRLRSAALALLRPAEAALRRLILIAARGIGPASGAVAFPAGAPFASVPAATETERARVFPLFDSIQRFAPSAPQPRGEPRIRFFWGASAAPAPALPHRADPDALVDARKLRLRLLSFQRALADLSRQARRLVRRRLRAGLRQPLRPGRPPGHRFRAGREVDLVLRECHALAMDSLRSNTT